MGQQRGELRANLYRKIMCAQVEAPLQGRQPVIFLILVLVQVHLVKLKIAAKLHPHGLLILCGRRSVLRSKHAVRNLLSLVLFSLSELDPCWYISRIFTELFETSENFPSRPINQPTRAQPPNSQSIIRSRKPIDQTTLEFAKTSHTPPPPVPIDEI